MRRFFRFLLFLPLLAGCQTDQQTSHQYDSQTVLDYDDFTDNKIEWKDLFSPAKSQYFVYIYSISCGHCNQIKEEVLTFVSAHKESFYLIEFSAAVTLTNNVAETIGKEKVEEIFILGTPTLLEISNWVLTVNIAGEKDILNFLRNLPHSDSC